MAAPLGPATAARPDRAPPPRRRAAQVSRSLNAYRKGTPMQPSDWALCRRTLTDMAMLVPYTIIMVIPLSPPGHVFAVSLLNRCFPAAVPSQFTSQRQDVYEIYSRIAVEARSNEADADADQPRSAPEALAPVDPQTGAKGPRLRLRGAVRGLRDRVAAARATRQST